MVGIVAGHRTDIGLVRLHNEDSALVGRRIWAVADGMGGHAAGDVASRLVIEGLRPLDAVAELRAADVVAALRETNERILAYGSTHPDALGLGSTVTGVALVGIGAVPHWAIFNVGDSRVYRVSGDVLTRATVDHTEAEQLVHEGVITPQQARSHRSRNILTRSLGQPGTLLVDLWVAPVTPGERFLVCSDGLTSELDDDAIRHIVVDTEDPNRAADALVEAALLGGGRDNVTAIVVDVAGLDADGPGHP